MSPANSRSPRGGAFHTLRPVRPFPTWYRDVLTRLGRHFWLKAVGTTLGMTGFFVGYFAILNHPLRPVTVIPALALDEVIAFHPLWLLPYLSLWLYVSLVPALLWERREVFRYAIDAALLAGSGLLIFLVWPTAIAPPDIDWSRHATVAFLKTVDAAGNACPSLHVAFSVFTACWFERLHKEMEAGTAIRIGNFLWAIGIIYSTLATKQHVVIDVICGIALGGLLGARHLCCRPAVSRG